MRNVSSLDVAVQLTRRDFEVFRSIEPSEYISDLFELEAADRDGRRQSSRHLDRFSEVTTTTTATTTVLLLLLLLLMLLLLLQEQEDEEEQEQEQEEEEKAAAYRIPYKSSTNYF